MKLGKYSFRHNIYPHSCYVGYSFGSFRLGKNTLIFYVFFKQYQIVIAMEKVR